MKISIKTLKGNHFDIQADSNDTIVAVKKTIEDLQGVQVYPADRQVLIYQGKVLQDTSTLEENNVVDNSFIVVMLTKLKPAAPVGSSSTVAPAGQAQTQAAIPQPSTAPSTQPPAATVPVAAPAAIVPPSGEANVYDQAASNLVAGSGLESTIQQILDMGGGSWDRDTVLRALRAAFNNPERAVEYLYSGIPEQAEVPQVARAPAAAPAGGQATVPPVQVPQVAAPSGVPNASPLDLFPQGIPNVGSNAAGTGSLDFLRNSQQFQALRSMVQANPQILQPMLQELGKQNPHLMRLIQEHQNDFVRLMNEPVEGGDEGNLLSQLGAAMPAMPPPTLNITPEEHAAVERLEAMGFRRETVLQVYFACNKDETLAANYLVDHMEELMNEDEEALS